MSSGRDVPWGVSPGDVLFPWATGTVLCSRAASQLHCLLHFYLEHRCAPSPADALLPWANHLLEQMLIFVFQGKMHAMLEPWADRRKCSPRTHFPQSPADGSAGICPTSLCQALSFPTRPLSIVPASVRGAYTPKDLKEM